VKVEPLEFISSGGRGEALSRLVKSRFLTFYEVINVGKPDFRNRQFPPDNGIQLGNRPYTGPGLLQRIQDFPGIPAKRPLKNVQFCPRSRKTKILSTGIHLVFRGIKFEFDTEIGQKGVFFKGLANGADDPDTGNENPF